MKSDMPKFLVVIAALIGALVVVQYIRPTPTKPGIDQPDNHRIALSDAESYGTLVARFTHSANLAGEGVVMMHFTDHLTKKQWLLISLQGCQDTVCVDVTPVVAEKEQP